MEGRVLNLQYMSNYYKLVVPDVDKCLLMDVLNDMVDGFGSNGYELPENLILS